MRIILDIESVNKGIFYRKSNIDKIYTESLKNEQNILFEKYCVYDKQYDDVNLIYDKIIECVKHKWNSTTLESTNGKEIILNIGTTYSKEVSACCTLLDDDSMCLTITLPLYMCYDISEFEGDIKSEIECSLAHELNHDLLQRELKTNAKPLESPKWYDASVAICTSYDHSSEEYHFAYAVYLSYYKEVQAMVSEIPIFVDKYIKSNISNFNDLSKKEKIKEIKNALCNSTAFKAYSTTLLRILPEIKYFIWDEKNHIKIAYKNNGYDLSESDYNKMVKQIEYSCKRALSKMRYSLNNIYEKYRLI